MVNIMNKDIVKLAKQEIAALQILNLLRSRTDIIKNTSNGGISQ